MKFENKKGMCMFFAVLVMALFFMLPVCEAQSVSAGNNLGSQVSNADYAGSRIDILNSMSFVEANIDPFTRSKIIANGGPVPAPVPPVSIDVPVPFVPDVIPMTSAEARKMAEEVITLLPQKEADRISASVLGTSASSMEPGSDEGSAEEPYQGIASQMSYEQGVFDTISKMSNVDDEQMCIMPGIPGAEVSGAGFEDSGSSSIADPGVSAMSNVRPSGGSGSVGGEKGGSGAGGGGGGGGGEDDDIGASFAGAQARVEYLQTIANWASETYQQGTAIAKGFETLLSDTESQDAYGSAFEGFGTPDSWKKVGEGLASAWNGVRNTATLYAENIGTFKKITNALQDRSGQGAGNRIYEYEGILAQPEVRTSEIEEQITALENQRIGTSGTPAYGEIGTKIEALRTQLSSEGSQGKTQAAQYYGTIAARQADVENYEYQLEQVSSLPLTTAERRAKEKELESKLAEAKKDLDNAHKGIDSKTLRELDELDKKINDPKTDSAELAKLKDKKAKINENLAKGADKNKANAYLDTKAKEFGLNTGRDAMRYMGLKNADNKISDLIGSPGGMAGGDVWQGTGLHGSMENLKETFETLKEVLDPISRKNAEKEIKEYDERMTELKKDKKELDNDLETAKQDGTISDEERTEHQEMQQEITEEALDLAGDITKSFKEMLTGATRNIADLVKKLWDKVKEKSGEVPGSPCSKQPKQPCPANCDKDLYGQAEIKAGEAASARPTSSPESIGIGSTTPGGSDPTAGLGPSTIPSDISIPSGDSAGPSTSISSNPTGNMGPTAMPDVQGPGLGGDYNPTAGPIGFISLALSKITGGITGLVGAGDAGGSAPVPTDSGAGPSIEGQSESSAQCVKSKKCFSFPEPPPKAEGEGDGGGAGPAGQAGAGQTGKDGAVSGTGGFSGAAPGSAEQEFGMQVNSPPDLQAIVDEGVSIEPPPSASSSKGPEVTGNTVNDPVKTAEDDQRAAEGERTKLLDKAAQNHGLTPIPSRSGYYQNSQGQVYMPDPKNNGFIAVTDSNLQAVETAGANLDTASANYDSAVSSGNPDLIAQANAAVAAANAAYQETVSITYSAPEKKDIETTDRNVADKILKSIEVSLEQKYPDPKTRPPEVAAAIHDLRNERLIAKIDAVKKQYEGRHAFMMYAAIQKVYEEFIDKDTPEGKEISQMDDKISDKTMDLIDEMAEYPQLVENALSEANAVANEAKGAIDRERANYDRHNQRYEQAVRLGNIDLVSLRAEINKGFYQSSVDLAMSGGELPERGSAHETASYSQTAMARSQQRLSEMTGAANKKLADIKKKVDDAKKKIEDAKKAIMDDYRKVADKKLSAPGLQDHFNKGGQPTEKGNQFRQLKAAERAAFDDRFNKDANLAMRELLASLSPGAGAPSSGERTVAGTAGPVSLGDIPFPVKFSEGGVLKTIQLSEFMLGESTRALQAAMQRSKINLNVRDSATSFEDLKKVMEIKGNKLKGLVFVGNMLNNMQNNADEIQKAIDSGNFHGKKGESKSITGQSQAGSQPASAGPSSGTAPVKQASPPQVSAPSGPTGMITGAGVSDAVADSTAGKISTELWGGVGSVISSIGSGIGQSVSGLFDTRAGERAAAQRERDNRAERNFKAAVERDLASVNQQTNNLQADIKAEIKQSGFGGYRENALMWLAGQVSNSEYLASLNAAQKELESLAGVAREEYSRLLEERTNRIKNVLDEYDAEIKACGNDADCLAKTNKEYSDRIAKLHKEYDPRLEKAKSEFEAALNKADPEIAAAIREILDLRSEAEQKIIVDEKARLKKEILVAKGDYLKAVEEDEAKGLKSLSLWTELGFEAWDREGKEQSVALAEQISRGADMFGSIQEDLAKKDRNLGDLLSVIAHEGVKFNSGPDAVRKWIDHVNAELGLTGSDRIDISSYSDEQLQDLAVYWDTFGNAVAKQVEGTYTDADMARGFYLTGTLKKTYGDLSGAERDLSAAVSIGGSSYTGEEAKRVLSAVQQDISGQMISRTIIDVAADPLNFVTFGSLAVMKGAQALNKGRALLQGLAKVTKVADAISDVSKTVGKSLKAVGEVPGISHVIDITKTVGGTASDIMKGSTARKFDKSINSVGDVVATLKRDLETAESAGDAAKARQIADQISSSEKIVDALKGAKKESSFWTQNMHLFTPRGQNTVVGLSKQVEAAAADIGKNLGGPDLAKFINNADKVSDQFKAVQKARDVLKAAPKGAINEFLTGEGSFIPSAAPKGAVDAARRSASSLDDAVKVFNRAIISGQNVEGSLNAMKRSVGALEDANTVIKAGERMALSRFLNDIPGGIGKPVLGAQEGLRSATNWVDDFTSGLRGMPVDGVRNARAQVRYAENALDGALRTGNSDNIIRAWDFMENSNRALSSAEDAARVTRGMQEIDQARDAARVISPAELPPTVRANPARTADDVQMDLNKLIPENAAPRARAVERDVSVLPDPVASRNAQNRADALNDMADTGTPVVESPRPVPVADTSVPRPRPVERVKNYDELINENPSEFNRALGEKLIEKKKSDDMFGTSDWKIKEENGQAIVYDGETRYGTIDEFISNERKGLDSPAINNFEKELKTQTVEQFIDARAKDRAIQEGTSLERAKAAEVEDFFARNADGMNDADKQIIEDIRSRAQSELIASEKPKLTAPIYTKDKVKQIEAKAKEVRKIAPTADEIDNYDSLYKGVKMPPSKAEAYIDELLGKGVDSNIKRRGASTKDLSFNEFKDNLEMQTEYFSSTEFNSFTTKKEIADYYSTSDLDPNAASIVIEIDPIDVRRGQIDLSKPLSAEEQARIADQGFFDSRHMDYNPNIDGYDHEIVFVGDNIPPERIKTIYYNGEPVYSRPVPKAVEPTVMTPADARANMNELLNTADQTPMQDLAKKRGFVSAEVDETGTWQFKKADGTVKSYDELYDEYSVARDQAYSDMMSAKKAGNTALENQKAAEITKYDAYKDNLQSANKKVIEQGIDARAQKTAGERGISVEQAKYDESARLYEGQQMRLDDVKQRAADARAKGNFEEAKKLNGEYRRLSNEDDVLFSIREKSYTDTISDIIVPDAGIPVQKSFVDELRGVVADSLNKADASEARIIEEVASEFPIMTPENIAFAKANAPKTISPCTKCALGSEYLVNGKAKNGVKNWLDSNRIQVQMNAKRAIPDAEWNKFVDDFSEQFASVAHKDPDVQNQATVEELLSNAQDYLISKAEAARVKQVEAVNTLGPKSPIINDAVSNVRKTGAEQSVSDIEKQIEATKRAIAQNENNPIAQNQFRMQLEKQTKQLNDLKAKQTVQAVPEPIKVILSKSAENNYNKLTGNEFSRAMNSESMANTANVGFGINKIAVNTIIDVRTGEIIDFTNYATNLGPNMDEISLIIDFKTGNIEKVVNRNTLRPIEEGNFPSNVKKSISDAVEAYNTKINTKQNIIIETPAPKTLQSLEADLQRVNADWAAEYNRYNSAPPAEKAVIAQRTQELQAESKRLTSEISSMKKTAPAVVQPSVVPQTPVQKVVSQVKEQVKVYPAEIKKAAEAVLPVKQAPAITPPTAKIGPRNAAEVKQLLKTDQMAVRVSSNSFQRGFSPVGEWKGVKQQLSIYSGEVHAGKPENILEIAPASQVLNYNYDPSQILTGINKNTGDELYALGISIATGEFGQSRTGGTSILVLTSKTNAEAMKSILMNPKMEKEAKQIISDILIKQGVSYQSIKEYVIPNVRTFSKESATPFKHVLKG